MLRPDFSGSRSTGLAFDRAQEFPRLFKRDRGSICADYQANSYLLLSIQQSIVQ